MGYRYAALARAAVITGWRKSELRSRQWPHVDFGAGWIRLEPEETRNTEGRQFPLIPELRALLEAQRARVEEIQKKAKRIIPWVFVRALWQEEMLRMAKRLHRSGV